MAEKTLNTRQKQKYDISTNWTTNNPVLLAGELGIESDTNKFKIGNGTSTWNELDYVGSGEVVLYSTTGQNTDGAMTQKAITDALPQCIEIEMNMQTGQASITVEQFEKLLENQENYIVVNMSLTDSDGSTRTESVKFIRGSYRKEETPSYWVEKLFFNSVNTGDTEKNPYMYLILARHSISPNDIGIGMGGEEYATVNQLNNKVDKVTNMGLSTNDYTTADKNKLAGIEAGAEVNTVTSVNGKTGAITLSADDVNALPNTTVIPTALSDLTSDITHRTVTDIEKSTWNAKSDFSGSYNDLTDKPNLFSGNYNDLTDKPTIPTSLSELTEDSAHRLVTDTEKTTWNAKSDFSGSYNDLTDKPTISTINIGSQPQSTINFTSDPQTQINNIVNNTTKIKNSSNGFAGGYNASAGLGGAIGNNSYTTYGGAIGWHSDSKHGGAVGNGARATDGGAIGSGATNTIGFSGGYEAKTGTTLDPIDAIQLGSGTNTIEKSLQIYDDNIYNADTHTLTVQNATVGGNEVDTIEAQGTNYIRYSNGIQICWGDFIGRNTTVTLPMAFSNTNYVVVAGVSHNGQTNYGVSVDIRSNTTFYSYMSDSNRQCSYIAIGYWK